MHLIYENLIPNLVLLWTGDFKGLDEGSGQYHLDGAIWEAIGKATAESGSTIPSAYGPRVRNVKDDRAYLTADMWSFWALYIGPVLLHRKFTDQKYYHHFIQLVELLNACLSFELSFEEVRTIREGFIAWVERYEEFYYQLAPERLSTCVLTVHALLHIADSIVEMGPVWAYWAFPMEHYCGLLQRSIRSRRYPFSNLSQTVLSDARLKQLGLCYNIHQMLSLKPPEDAYICGQLALPNYSTCILLPPRLPSGTVQDPQLLKRIQVHFATRFGRPLAAVRRGFSGAQVEAFGRVRRIGGDTMWASSMISHSEDRRDPTWIRYDALVDQNAARRNAPEDYSRGPTIFYGQLQHLVVVTLPAMPSLNLTECTQYVLADIYTAKTDIDGLLDSKMYDSMSTVQVFDITCVQNLVGRLKMLTLSQNSRAKGVWAIIDRSERSDGAIYVPEAEERDSSAVGEDASVM
ncbi:hypothetical protein BDY19DRAFT_900743 [Irpex rosettiformis]|uniref:Uncharacterized protein n=1 Tax=Irpex rosettiformis TaxID=378272 RepID=A0ACB8TMH7_9APHY|nr:hypothetical protein BDY19DRAFT_900743 [Irpex rosettiformis]